MICTGCPVFCCRAPKNPFRRACERQEKQDEDRALDREILQKENQLTGAFPTRACRTPGTVLRREYNFHYDSCNLSDDFTYAPLQNLYFHRCLSKACFLCIYLSNCPFLKAFSGMETNIHLNDSLTVDKGIL